MCRAPRRTRRSSASRRLLQIEPLLQRKPGQLSGGQRQRVAMGRALVRDPKLFLFDEPLSNLDAKLRVEMRSEIKKLHQRVGKTTVYVTHDQVEAMTLASRIAVMHKGELQQFAEPRIVYDRPANVFVASFMGSPSMNFLKARDRRRAGRRRSARRMARSGPLTLALAQANGGRRATREVILGVRPEHISLHRPERAADKPRLRDRFGAGRDRRADRRGDHGRACVWPGVKSWRGSSRTRRPRSARPCRWRSTCRAPACSTPQTERLIN